MYSNTEMEYNFNSTTTSFANPLTPFKTQLREDSNQQNTPIVIFLDRDKSLSPTFLLPYKRKKYYWGKENIFNPSEKIMGPYMVYEATEEQLEQSQITITSWLPSSKARKIEESEQESQLSIITPPHKRKVLFTKKITFRISELPRWKPHIEINSRILKDIDD